MRESRLISRVLVDCILIRVAKKFRSGNAEGSAVILGVHMLFRSMRGRARCSFVM